MHHSVRTMNTWWQLLKMGQRQYRQWVTGRFCTAWSSTQMPRHGARSTPSQTSASLPRTTTQSSFGMWRLAKLSRCSSSKVVCSRPSSRMITGGWLWHCSRGRRCRYCHSMRIGIISCRTQMRHWLMLSSV